MLTKIGKNDLLDEAAELIKKNELVAFPTETVYGLGANALSEVAVSKIFKAKQRPKNNPLIVHISDVNMLNLVAENVTKEVIDLFNFFSPGPLTIILKKSKNIAPSVSPNLETVGVRIPNHEMALELIRRAGVPIAAPSANISSRVSATSAKHVWEDFNGKIPLILEGGECSVGIESTILDMTKKTPIILRPGHIKSQDLMKVIPSVKIKTGEIKIAEAPGMLYKHYAPVCKCVLAKNLQSAIHEYDSATNEKPVIIGDSDYVKMCGDRNTISLGVNFDEIEKNYFFTLRQAEKIYNHIIIQFFSDNNAFAIMNRILKSCGGTIV